MPLLIEQPNTEKCRRWLSEDEAMLAWWAMPVECVSAVCRLEREGSLAPMEAEAILERLSQFGEAWIEVSPSVEIRSVSRRLLRVHPLRAMESLHLAAALVAAEHQPVGVEFVCFDERLAMAARREGFQVLS